MNQENRNQENSRFPSNDISQKTEVKEKESEEKSTNPIIKGLAIIGIIALLFAGLYFSARVLAGIPNAARSVASGFVSVTSRFFDADDDVIVEDNNEDNLDDEDEDSDEDEDENDEDVVDDNVDGDSVVGNDSGSQTDSTTYYRTEYRVEQRPVSITPVSDPNGYTDLKVTIIATGIMSNRNFVERDEISRRSDAAVKFQVENIGTKTSDKWQYTAKLPTSPSKTYRSPDQMQIGPGEKIEYIISFDSLSSSKSLVEIEVDPRDNIGDLNRTNNEVSVNLDIE